MAPPSHLCPSCHLACLQLTTFLLLTHFPPLALHCLLATEVKYDYNPLSPGSGKTVLLELANLHKYFTFQGSTGE